MCKEKKPLEQQWKKRSPGKIHGPKPVVFLISKLYISRIIVGNRWYSNVPAYMYKLQEVRVTGACLHVMTVPWGALPMTTSVKEGVSTLWGCLGSPSIA